MNKIGDAPRDQRGISRCKVAVSSYVRAEGRLWPPLFVAHRRWCCQLLCVVADDVLLDLPLVFCRAYARLAICLPLIDEKKSWGQGCTLKKYERLGQASGWKVEH